MIGTSNAKKKKSTFHALRVRRMRIIRIRLLVAALVEADESPVEKLVACSVVAGSSLVVQEVVLEPWRAEQFLGEGVDLVQE